MNDLEQEEKQEIQEKMYSVKEAVNFLQPLFDGKRGHPSRKISESMVYTAKAEGELKAEKLGTHQGARLAFPESALIEYAVMLGYPERLAKLLRKRVESISSHEGREDPHIEQPTEIEHGNAIMGDEGLEETNDAGSHVEGNAGPDTMEETPSSKGGSGMEERGEDDLSVDDARIFLGQLLKEEVTSSTLHNAVHRGGILGSYKIDNRRFFPKTSLIQYARDYRGYQEDEPLSEEAQSSQRIDLEQVASPEVRPVVPEMKEEEERTLPASFSWEEEPVGADDHVVEEPARSENGYHGRTSSQEALSSAPPQVEAPPAQILGVCYRCGRQFFHKSESAPEEVIIDGRLTYQSVCSDRRCDPVVQAAAAALVAQLEEKNAALERTLRRVRALGVEITYISDSALLFLPEKED